MDREIIDETCDNCHKEARESHPFFGQVDELCIDCFHKKLRKEEVRREMEKNFNI